MEEYSTHADARFTPIGALNDRGPKGSLQLILTNNLPHIFLTFLEFLDKNRKFKKNYFGIFSIKYLFLKKMFIFYPFKTPYFRGFRNIIYKFIKKT